MEFRAKRPGNEGVEQSLMNTERAAIPSTSFMWKPAKFAGLDEAQWLIILLAVLLGTLAKRSQLLGLPAWFLDWVLPFLLIIFGYNIRQGIAGAVRRVHGLP